MPKVAKERFSRLSNFESLSLVAAAVAALINLCALVFIGVQARNAVMDSRRNARNQEDERIRQRKRDTIDAVMATSQHHADLKDVLPWNDRDKENVARFLEKIEPHEAKREVVRKYLDYIELVAVGLKQDVFDLETVKAMSGERFLAVATNYRPYIKRRREELKSPELYAEIEWMATKLQE